VDVKGLVRYHLRLHRIRHVFVLLCELLPDVRVVRVDVDAHVFLFLSEVLFGEEEHHLAEQCSQHTEFILHELVFECIDACVFDRNQQHLKG